MSRGLSFAISINEARSVAQQLITRGYLIQPWLGLEIQSLSDGRVFSTFPETSAGVLIRSIFLKTPAAEQPAKPPPISTPSSQKTKSIQKTWISLEQ